MTGGLEGGPGTWHFGVVGERFGGTGAMGQFVIRRPPRRTRVSYHRARCQMISSLVFFWGALFLGSVRWHGISAAPARSKNGLARGVIFFLCGLKAGR